MNTDDVELFLEQYGKRSLLRFSTAGSVDDGKSTFIGRLLHDSKAILEDHLISVKNASRNLGEKSIDFSLFTDGLKAEREQRITIDVAYRYFSTPKRNFIIADTPGHEQYTRNMATGASTAHLTVILIDASHGIVTQTRRHSFIASLLGIPRFLIAVNKMDLVDYSEQVFNRIRDDYTEFAAKLSVANLEFIPISALRGDNVVDKSTHMPWFMGSTVLQYLENEYVGGDRNLVDFRFPVQMVVRPNPQFRGFSGQISSGVIRVGDEVVILPNHKKTRVRSITTFNADIPYAYAPMSVTLTLDDEIDISRGDMIVRSQNIPHIDHEIEVMVVWMSEKPLSLTTQYTIKHTSRSSKAQIENILYKVDVNTLHREDVPTLHLNEIGRIQIRVLQPLFIDPYAKNRLTGSLILIDPMTNSTVAAGMVIDRMPRAPTRLFGEFTENLTRPDGLVTIGMRETALHQRAITIWLTGLSASGKSTIAVGLEKRMFDSGRAVYRLDGDNIRFGLNRDLGFSATDRAENIRRVAEAAKLLNDAGLICIVALISPYHSERQSARQIVGADRFHEIFIDTPLEVCEMRDPKGLYRKARAGEISNFTGVSDPYEKPTHPALTLDTTDLSVGEAVDRILNGVKGL